MLAESQLIILIKCWYRLNAVGELLRIVFCVLLERINFALTFCIVGYCVAFVLIYHQNFELQLQLCVPALENEVFLASSAI
jgi:hypothetical protein